MKNQECHIFQKFNQNRKLRIGHVWKVSSFFFLIFCIFFIFSHWIAEAIDLQKNPFLIDFPELETFTDHDYIALQKKLRLIDLNPLLAGYYKEYKELVDCDDSEQPYELFYNRCTKFLHRNFILPEQQLLPRKELIKINDGGDNCVVCSAPYAKQYPSLLFEQLEALKKTHFNGYYLFFLGAYPNPTGKEIAYAGVPYALKIFAMIEAQKLGFNKVLWLDSALSPIRDITPIFDEIEKTGFVAHLKKCKMNEYTLLFPTTRALLQSLTSVDVLQSQRVFATLLGLKMDHPLTKNFISQYYTMVEMGTPFISGLPEEFVFTAILGQTMFSEWIQASEIFENRFSSLFCSEDRQGWEFPWFPSRSGFFFTWNIHDWVDNVNCVIPHLDD